MKGINQTHGMSRSREYGIWGSMIKRCTNPNYIGYEHYGGKGITVCDRWLHSFEDFIADVGPRPSPKHSIDRTDNDDNYEPGNVKWRTPNEQANNKSTNRYLEFNGKKLTMTQWGDSLGILPATIYSRLRMGWSVEDALTKPINTQFHKRLLGREV